MDKLTDYWPTPWSIESRYDRPVRIVDAKGRVVMDNEEYYPYINVGLNMLVEFINTHAEPTN